MRHLDHIHLLSGREVLAVYAAVDGLHDSIGHSLALSYAANLTAVGLIGTDSTVQKSLSDLVDVLDMVYGDVGNIVTTVGNSYRATSAADLQEVDSALVVMRIASYASRAVVLLRALDPLLQLLSKTRGGVESRRQLMKAVAGLVKDALDAGVALEGVVLSNYLELVEADTSQVAGN